MTSRSQKIPPSGMPGAATMPTGLNVAISPEQFAAEARAIAQQPITPESHRAMDRLCMATLRSLGFGEGCAIFEQFTEGYHE